MGHAEQTGGIHKGTTSQLAGFKGSPGKILVPDTTGHVQRS